MARLLKSVVMVGMMGAGKTAVGAAVARCLGVPFLDTDAEIQRAANATVSEIFARSGEAFFREKEHQILVRLLADRPCILSTGGGAYLVERNRAAISSHGVALWIRADRRLLWNRVRHKDTRPLLRTADPKATLFDLIETREPSYRLADLVVDAEPGLSVDEMAQKTIGVIARRCDVLETRE
jgi:shikimate kinase